jgi:hypothetical protein
MKGVVRLDDAPGIAHPGQFFHYLLFLPRNGNDVPHVSIKIGQGFSRLPIRYFLECFIAKTPNFYSGVSNINSNEVELRQINTAF